MTGEIIARGGDIARIWAPSGYNRKPTGMIAVDGDGDGKDELYLAVQDLNAQPCPACFNDAPNASISKSLDYGKTWHTTDAAMFTNHRFTTYPYDRSAGPHRSFVLSFRASRGDGVRIIGPPGGSARYTSIAELEVYYVA